MKDILSPYGSQLDKYDKITLLPQVKLLKIATCSFH